LHVCFCSYCCCCCYAQGLCVMAVAWQSSADTCQTDSQTDRQRVREAGRQTVRVVVTVVTVSNTHSYLHTHTLTSHTLTSHTLHSHTPRRQFERLASELNFKCFLIYFFGFALTVQIAITNFLTLRMPFIHFILHSLILAHSHTHTQTYSL